jgi:hypothetical protein
MEFGEQDPGGRRDPGMPTSISTGLARVLRNREGSEFKPCYGIASACGRDTHFGQLAPQTHPSLGGFFADACLPEVRGGNS